VSEAGPVALAEVVSGPGLREGIGVDGGGWDGGFAAVSAGARATGGGGWGRAL